MDEPLDLVKKISSDFTPDADLYANVKEKMMEDNTASKSNIVETKSLQGDKIFVGKAASASKPNRGVYLALVAGFVAVGGVGAYSIMGNSDSTPVESSVAASPETTVAPDVTGSSETTVISALRSYEASNLQATIAADEVTVKPLDEQSDSIGGHRINNVTGGDISLMAGSGEQVRLLFASDETDWWVAKVIILETGFETDSDVAEGFVEVNEKVIEGEFFRTPLGDSFSGNFEQDGVSIDGMDLTFNPYIDDNNGEVTIVVKGPAEAIIGSGSLDEFELQDIEGNVLDKNNFFVNIVGSDFPGDKDQVAIVVAPRDVEEGHPDDLLAVKVVSN